MRANEISIDGQKGRDGRGGLMVRFLGCATISHRVILHGHEPNL